MTSFSRGCLRVCHSASSSLLKWFLGCGETLVTELMSEDLRRNRLYHLPAVTLHVCCLAFLILCLYV